MLLDRRTLLVGGAAVVALAAVAWTWFGPSTATPSAQGGQGVAARRGGSEAPLPKAETVRLAVLAQHRDEPTEITRNPFKFEARRAPVSAAGTTQAPPVFTMKPQDAPPVPTGPPPPPPIPLKFIGMVERADGTRLAVLVPNQGGTPMHGKDGDIIDGRYRIVKIGTESIEMTYVDGRGRQTIRLTGR